MAKKKKDGIGKWVATTMEVDVPGAPGETVMAVGIYNTETEEFKIVETLGHAFEEYLEENPDESSDDLIEAYEREAAEWASTHNSKGF